MLPPHCVAVQRFHEGGGVKKQPDIKRSREPDEELCGSSRSSWKQGRLTQPVVSTLADSLEDLQEVSFNAAQLLTDCQVI